MSERVGSSSEGESEREMGKGRTGINRERFIWMVVSEFVEKRAKGRRGSWLLNFEYVPCFSNFGQCVHASFYNSQLTA